jgi:hypothetical protein
MQFFQLRAERRHGGKLISKDILNGTASICGKIHHTAWNFEEVKYGNEYLKQFFTLMKTVFWWFYLKKPLP